MWNAFAYLSECRPSFCVARLCELVIVALEICWVSMNDVFAVCSYTWRIQLTVVLVSKKCNISSAIGNNVALKKKSAVVQQITFVLKKHALDDMHEIETFGCTRWYDLVFDPLYKTVCQLWLMYAYGASPFYPVQCGLWKVFNVALHLVQMSLNRPNGCLQISLVPWLLYWVFCVNFAADFHRWCIYSNTREFLLPISTRNVYDVVFTHQKRNNFLQ